MSNSSNHNNHPLKLHQTYIADAVSLPSGSLSSLARLLRRGKVIFQDFQQLILSSVLILPITPVSLFILELTFPAALSNDSSDSKMVGLIAVEFFFLGDLLDLGPALFLLLTGYSITSSSSSSSLPSLSTSSTATDVFAGSFFCLPVWCRSSHCFVRNFLIFLSSVVTHILNDRCVIPNHRWQLMTQNRKPC